MKIRSVIYILIIITASNGYSDDFDYLSPEEVTEIPSEYAKILKAEGCTIPKWKYGFGGVTAGEFAKAGQIDLAILCKKAQGAFVRIFWSGEAPCPDTIESYGQFIDKVGKEFIVRHYEAYGGNEPPQITHEGINDNFVEKASTVRYCHNNTWMELTGAD